LSKIIQWKRGELLELSAHFKSTEFNCHCMKCDQQMIDSLLIHNLENMRAAVGAIQVTSGYRCQAYQRQLAADGHETAKGISQHELGRAADIRPYKLGIMADFEQQAARYFKAIGIAETWLHVDLRSDKVRRWRYK
jgi:uncharacterized protein YcbK (DUF882 family)